MISIVSDSIGGRKIKKILKAQALHKTYKISKENHLNVLVDVNLQITEGEFVTIMGPSGSGKSTLLYNISGMDRPTSGKLIFQGRNVENFSEEQLAQLRLQDMGFIFQNMYLLSNLNVYDNIILPGYTLNQEKRQVINERAKRLMEQMGIVGLENHDITQISGGQLQRAAICRALINNPFIIFGDEPTGALNSKFATDVMDILERINQNGTTIFLATHDIKVAVRTERVLYMKDGKITGEYYLGKLNMNEKNLLIREEKLAQWLNEQGF